MMGEQTDTGTNNVQRPDPQGWHDPQAQSDAFQPVLETSREACKRHARAILDPHSSVGLARLCLAGVGFTALTSLVTFLSYRINSGWQIGFKDGIANLVQVAGMLLLVIVAAYAARLAVKRIREPRETIPLRIILLLAVAYYVLPLLGGLQLFWTSRNNPTYPLWWRAGQVLTGVGNLLLIVCSLWLILQLLRAWQNDGPDPLVDKTPPNTGLLYARPTLNLPAARMWFAMAGIPAALALSLFSGMWAEMNTSDEPDPMIFLSYAQLACYVLAALSCLILRGRFRVQAVPWAIAGVFAGQFIYWAIYGHQRAGIMGREIPRSLSAWEWWEMLSSLLFLASLFWIASRIAIYLHRFESRR